jgi:uncharacterized protein (DUF4415 family)
MYVTDSTGRPYRLPTKEEETRIRAGIAADPDAVELTEAQLAELRPWSEMRSQTKQTVSIPLSTQVLEHFKADGAGWQTRIDAALREYVAAHSN